LARDVLTSLTIVGYRPPSQTQGVLNDMALETSGVMKQFNVRLAFSFR
jgi:hypothetical protein